MDKKRYSKTRYDSIYQNKKNKNYIIVFHNKTISLKDGNKITSLEEARQIRDNERGIVVNKPKTFKNLFADYMYESEKIELNSFNRLKKKKIIYNKYLSYFDNYIISKITTDMIISYRDKLTCSDKQKNCILEELRCFFNWCIKKEYIIKAPTKYIKLLQVEKTKMKYWNEQDIKKFISVLDDSPKGRLIRMLVMIELSTGDRIGETRALRYCDIDRANLRLHITHSINYSTSSQTFLKSPKNYQSSRVLDISSQLINEIDNYKSFLEDTYKIDIPDTYPILFNLKTNKPYADTLLRKYFNYFIDLAGVPKIRLYDLRHSYVTIMMQNGFELYHISERLGHINYNTTVNKYGHLSNKIRKEIANSTDKYIF